MTHMYTNLIHHLVWSTKNREAFISEKMEPRFYQYLGGAIRNEGGIYLSINGTEDHVHILAKFKPTMAIADVVGRIKANSSSASQINKVQKYIENQKAHHREESEESYRDEFIKMLDQH